MAKFRKKPIVIEAEQWVELKAEPLSPIPPAPDFMLRKHRKKWYLKTKRWQLKTMEGWLNLADGDWIIRGVAGEYYPCKPDIFARTYEEVEASE